MKNPRLIAGILLALAFALLTSACTSAHAGYTRIKELHTYAIVAVDEKGVLSQTDLAKIQIGIVQYLTDEGYVHSDQVFTDDVVHADVVYRVGIAWMDAGKSFAMTGVAPSYGSGPAPVEYAAEAAEPEESYVPWSYDPWLYNNSDYGYGYFYGPYAPWIFAPFAPIYVWDHHHRTSPSVIHHPPPSDVSPGQHRPPWWNGYTGYSPRPPRDDDALRHFPVHRPHDPTRNDRQSLPPSTWRSRNPDPDHRPPPSDSSTPPPHRPDTDHRPHPDSSTAGSQHSPPNDRPAPSRDVAPVHVRNPDSGSRPSPDSSSWGSRNSGSIDRSPPPSREYSQPSSSYSPPPPSSPPPSAPPPSSPPSSSSSDSNSQSVNKER